LEFQRQEGERFELFGFLGRSCASFEGERILRFWRVCRFAELFIAGESRKERGRTEVKFWKSKEVKRLKCSCRYKITTK
jgi:hypothetical protein